MKNFSLKWLKAEFLADKDAGQFVDRDRLLRGGAGDHRPARPGQPGDISNEGDGMSSVVENPYNEHILAGHLSGMYELGEGQRSNVDWSYLDEATIKFSITPRRSTQVMAV